MTAGSCPVIAVLHVVEAVVIGFPHLEAGSDRVTVGVADRTLHPAGFTGRTERDVPASAHLRRALDEERTEYGRLRSVPVRRVVDGDGLHRRTEGVREQDELLASIAGDVACRGQECDGHAPLLLGQPDVAQEGVEVGDNSAHQLPQSRFSAGVERCQHPRDDLVLARTLLRRDALVPAGGFSHWGSSPAQAACRSAVRVCSHSGPGDRQPLFRSSAPKNQRCPAWVRWGYRGLRVEPPDLASRSPVARLDRRRSSRAPRLPGRLRDRQASAEAGSSASLVAAAPASGRAGRRIATATAPSRQTTAAVRHPACRPSRKALTTAVRIAGAAPAGAFWATARPWATPSAATCRAPAGRVDMTAEPLRLPR